jgi:hypothetical protein
MLMTVSNGVLIFYHQVLGGTSQAPLCCACNYDIGAEEFDLDPMAQQEA